MLLLRGLEAVDMNGRLLGDYLLQVSTNLRRGLHKVVLGLGFVLGSVLRLDPCTCIQGLFVELSHMLYLRFVVIL